MCALMRRISPFWVNGVKCLGPSADSGLDVKQGVEERVTRGAERFKQLANRPVLIEALARRRAIGAAGAESGRPLEREHLLYAAGEGLERHLPGSGMWVRNRESIYWGGECGGSASPFGGRATFCCSDEDDQLLL